MTNMRTIRAAYVVAALLASCPCAFALNPELDIDRHAHTAWLASQGFLGVVRAITQTLDGYLWLGTELGIVRFDGVREVPWTFLPDQRLSSSSIISLVGTRDGSLWIEAEIRYDDHFFCLRIRDDGTGVDPLGLDEAERAGHVGLRDIRERAHRIGAQLDL